MPPVSPTTSGAPGALSLVGRPVGRIRRRGLGDGLVAAGLGLVHGLGLGRFRNRFGLRHGGLGLVRDRLGLVVGRLRLVGEHLFGQAQLGHVGLLALARNAEVDRLHRIAGLDAAQGQRQTAAVGVDLDDLDLDVLALLHDLARVLDVVLGQLGDVDQALDPGNDLGEGAERDDLGDPARHDVALLGLVDDALPRIGLGLLEAERDALAVAVDVEHLDAHLLADLEHLGRMVHVAPGELRDVDQTVDAVEIDERAEVDDVGDLALDLDARRQPVEDLLTGLLALLLEHRPPRQDDVVAAAVELDDLAQQRLVAVLLEILDATDVDQRRGQEAPHAEVDDQAALDDLDDLALDRLAALGRCLDALPRLLEAGALLRENQPALGVLLLEHERVDLLADLDLVVRVDGAADRELGDGDDALRLVADVDQDLVLVDADHGAGDDVALVEVGQRAVVVGDELPVDLDHPGIGISGCHRGWDVKIRWNVCSTQQAGK